MKWHIGLVFNKDIELFDVENLIDNLPSKYKGLQSARKIGRKWMASIIINEPYKKYLMLEGSGINRSLSYEIAVYIQNEMAKKKYKVKIGTRVEE